MVQHEIVLGARNSRRVPAGWLGEVHRKEGEEKCGATRRDDTDAACIRDAIHVLGVFVRGLKRRSTEVPCAEGPEPA